MFTAFACGVVVSLHASTPAATAAAAMRTRCGLAAEIKTFATWNNEIGRSETDMMTPDAGLRGLVLSFTLLKRNRRSNRLQPNIGCSSPTHGCNSPCALELQTRPHCSCC